MSHGLRQVSTLSRTPLQRSYDTLALASLRANMTVVGLMAASKIQLKSVRSMQRNTPGLLDRRIGPKDMFIVLLYINGRRANPAKVSSQKRPQQKKPIEQEKERKGKAVKEAHKQKKQRAKAKTKLRGTTKPREAPPHTRSLDTRHTEKPGTPSQKPDTPHTRSRPPLPDRPPAERPAEKPRTSEQPEKKKKKKKTPKKHPPTTKQNKPKDERGEKRRKGREGGEEEKRRGLGKAEPAPAKRSATPHEIDMDSQSRAQLLYQMHSLEHCRTTTCKDPVVLKEYVKQLSSHQCYRAKENSKGPRGSPCCTQHSEVILPSGCQSRG
ncbi:hypothetical protein EMCRGX_G012394 [Ephydatia muelleri]